MPRDERLRARTVLARQSAPARRLVAWTEGEQVLVDVAADVRAVLQAYDAVLRALRQRDERATDGDA